MNANELRIGNWIFWGEIAVKLEVHGIAEVSENENIYQPIPLTPEILEKCGFNGDESQNDFKFGNFRLKNWNDYKSWIATNGIGYDLYPQMPLIKYLHQLQNLYFALTGEELKINL